MKVAQVCHRYYPAVGGIQDYVKQLSERLAKSGVDVEVLTTDPSGKLPHEEASYGVKIKRFKSWAPGDTGYFSRGLREYLQMWSDSYDIVHAHNYNAIPAAYAAQAKHGNKLVISPHYVEASHSWLARLSHLPYRHLFGRRLFAKADKVICVSAYERNLILDLLGIHDQKTTVIPCGTDLEAFKHVRKQQKDQNAILYAGRVARYKGVEYLIKVLPLLREDFVVRIMGSGPYTRRLVELARRLKVESRVTISDFCERQALPRHYADAEVFALLSRAETYGISVAEALSVGTPCIVANTSALKEWVDDENCFGIEYPINLSKLAKLIERVAGREANWRNTNKLLDWTDVARRIRETYEEIV